MKAQDFGRSRLPHEHVATRTGQVATPSPTLNDSPTTERRRYTMTVEGVASLLHTHGLDRDSRTIQRWCKSGKIDALIDHANGERWLIDPATVQPVIDDIVAALGRRPSAFSATPPPTSAATATPAAARTGTENLEPILPGDKHRDATSESVDAATTSEPVDNEVSALKKKVSDLEFQNLQLKADVKSREQFNDYVKKQFESVLESNLDRAEVVGSLQKEVEVLRAMLPPGVQVPGPERASDEGLYESTGSQSAEADSV